MLGPLARSQATNLIKNIAHYLHFQCTFLFNSYDVLPNVYQYKHKRWKRCKQLNKNNRKTVWSREHTEYKTQVLEHSIVCLIMFLM